MLLKVTPQRIPDRTASFIRLPVLWIAFACILATRSAHAVIPGLAPALVAVLPQILFLLLVSGLLLFSPRAWWRFSRALVRRPIRAVCVLGSTTLLFLAACWIRAALPASPPLEPVPDHVHGYAMGDLRASRAARSHPGPRSLPRVRPAEELRDVRPLAGPLPFGERALLVPEPGDRVVCFDPAAGKIAWEFRGGARIVAPPIGFERRSNGGTWTGVICLVGEDPNRDAGPAAMTEAVIVQGSDGSPVSRLDLAGNEPHAALIDDRAIIAFEDAIACLSLTDPGHIGQAWRVPRPPGPIRGLAGDDEGRFFLLSGAGLLQGDLGQGRLEALATFGDETPAALAIHWGRIYVLLSRADGTRRLACIDPVLGGRFEWSRQVEGSAFLDLAASPFGVVLTSPRALDILDLATGRERARLTLPGAPASCPAAVSPHSCYVLLSTGDVIRYAPSTRRIEWHAPSPLPALDHEPALDDPGGGAMAICGERLLAHRRGLSMVISEASTEADSGWGQWRGGATRRGTSNPDRLPISAAPLWTLPLRGNDSGTAGAPLAPRSPLEVIPLEEGWLALDGAGPESRIHWVDDGGRVHESLGIEGTAWGLASAGGRSYSALRRTNQDLVACFFPQRSDGSASLRLLWKAPAGKLVGGHPLSAATGTIILCEESAIRAISSEDGSERWTSRDVKGSLAPAISGGRIVAAGTKSQGDGVLAALDVSGGSLLWKVERPGSTWGTPSVLEDRVVAALYPSQGEARLLELEIGSGIVRREIAGLPETPRGPIILTGERIIATGSAMTCILSPAGDLVGRLDGREPIAGIAGYGLLLVAGDSGVRCVDTSTLETVWALPLPGPADSLACERGLVVGTTGHRLFCLGPR